MLVLAPAGLRAQVDLRDAGSVYQSLGAVVVEPTYSFSFSHRIENLGPSALPLAEMSYYLSTNTTLDAGDPLVGGIKTGPFPVSGSFGTGVKVTLKVPANLAVGQYRLIGKMVATDLAEPEVRNNVFVHPTVIEVVDPPQFDLRSSLTPAISATSLIPNDPFQVTGRLINNGPEASPGFTVTWRLSKNAIIGDDDDIVLRSISYDPLNGPPGPGQFQATRNLATQLIISSTTAPAAGSYRIGFLIEAPQDTVQTNNAVLIPGTITLLNAHPGDVDLHFIGSGFGVSTTRPPFDGNFQLRATVRNRGNTTSNSFNVACYASTDQTLGNSDDVFLAIETYGGLTPINPATGGGASEFIDQKLDASGLTKNVPYYLVMIIVGGNDDNTANNTWISGTTITLGDAPDYRMGNWQVTNTDGFSGSITPGLNGERVRFTGRVFNDTPRGGSVDLEVTWTGSGNILYRGILSSADVPAVDYGSGNQLGQALSIPGNSSSFVDMTVNLRTFRQAGANPPYPVVYCGEFSRGYDVRIRAIPRADFNLNPSSGDASPGNNITPIQPVTLSGGGPDRHTIFHYDDETLFAFESNQRPPGVFTVTGSPPTITTTGSVRDKIVTICG